MDDKIHELTLIRLKPSLNNAEFLEALMEYHETQNNWVKQQLGEASVDDADPQNDFSRAFVTHSAPHELLLIASWTTLQAQGKWVQSPEHEKVLARLSKFMADGEQIDRYFVEPAKAQGNEPPLFVGQELPSLWILCSSKAARAVNDEQHADWEETLEKQGLVAWTGRPEKSGENIVVWATSGDRKAAPESLGLDRPGARHLVSVHNIFPKIEV
ncbi:hypothetical protein FDECE_2961 [Fusarium decemcellulare]|nr:hypothetical protein FDECE_2961 [Fusarium decemcellulare]